jgi:hypothetical protein
MKKQVGAIIMANACHVHGRRDDRFCSSFSYSASHVMQCLHQLALYFILKASLSDVPETSLE